MAYENINSKVFIARLDVNFNVDYSGYHSRVAEWVAQAIGLLKVPVHLEIARICKEVVNYRVQLPCDIKLIEAIVYKNQRLENLTHIINGNSSCDLESITYPYYQVLQNGWISTSFEEADAEDFVIHYKRMPVELDSASKVYFPLVPNVEPLLDAIDYFLLMRILQRGHQHPTFNLKDNNPFINPALAWTNKQKAARNSFTILDPDTRKQLSIVLNAFILNPDAYVNQFYSTNAYNS